ncbi:hypothetical protein [Uliginosibacterium gangwonense]|uniref:hypothetical protein n=1 Tax=Uliginosibacterium gangwonense TaxID=392736 RepID=UPI00039E7E83|nr:hypothetical protein [Uliginosibacterium gangwonense]
MNTNKSKSSKISICIISVFLLMGYHFGASAQDISPKNSAPATELRAIEMPEAAQAVTPKQSEVWRRAIIKTKPQGGCHRAMYPKLEWEPISCVTPPNRPYPPRKGPRGQTVGNGVDYSANTTGATTQAEGSFVNITGVTSESTVQPGGASSPNNFSLQLNTQFFQTQTCSGASNPGNCLGWEQFVVSNDPAGGTNGSFVFIQYWLINYNATCPAGWWSYGGDCYTNSTNSVPYTGVAIAQLGQMTVIGSAGNNSGAMDSIGLSIAGVVYSTNGNNYFPDLGQKWNLSEFNIVGDCCGSSAVFNAGSTITVQTAVNYGSAAAPSCSLQGFTGETNSLTLSGTPSAVPNQNWPSITFTQTNVSPSTASCATATSWGDTHIITFSGQTYDFQAAGEFTLLNDGAGFIVTAAQTSGAPSWPNTSVNNSITVQTQGMPVVIPSSGSTIWVKGTPFVIPSGQTRSFGQDVQITHNGTGYKISDPNGNQVQADVISANPPYVNAYVLPGKSLTSAAFGALIGSTSKGQVLPAKLAFRDLNNVFGKSWQVNPGTSRLPAKLKVGSSFTPAKKVFLAKHLSPMQRQHGMTVCRNAGVAEVWLEACTLDVVVIGNDSAAEAFTHLPAPKSVITIE